MMTMLRRLVLVSSAVAAIAAQQQNDLLVYDERDTGNEEGAARSSSSSSTSAPQHSSLVQQTAAGISSSDSQQQTNTDCRGARPRHDATQLPKRVYTVGVLAIRGPDAAYSEFNSTFASYLTATAGRRFDPPISFEMKALNFLTVFSDSEESLVDFIYVNPSAFSCIESEYGARSLVSQVSRRVVDDETYELKEFGGVIATLANRTDITTIHDLEGQVVAAASISGLGSGQMQFREMQRAGMSYINDPKQLVFTSNQGKVVNGLINGDFDVAFVRTDQIERSKDAQGNPIDRSLLKVIDPKPGLDIDGVPFPFQSSTPLYPEWNVAALGHVPDEVAAELQGAMLDVGSHAKVAASRRRCDEAEAGDEGSACDEFRRIDATERLCDTADEVADAALNATRQGKYSEWVPSLSYMELRSMQEATGFIEENQDKVWRCLRSAEIYDSISCPAGHIKKSELEVANGCSDEGLLCAEGYQCICSPCYKPFHCVDALPIGGKCVPYEVFLPALLVPVALLGIAACFIALSIKSKQMVTQAKLSAKNERDLNEFIAHEVRNPLSAALSAAVFVSNAVQSDVNEDTLDSLREDANIISSSLRFINDLLRSMLDVHRATRDQMVLEMDAVDMKHDIFQPIASMIYSRDTNFTVEVDCPEGLVVKSDKLRLQQIVLNLARNSAKFVNEGFIRLRAEVLDDSVYIFIEDSGPGIPEDKRSDLFNKYQKSLDSLAQGTGVGLSLVEKLVTLMDGSIYLDDGYTSGYKDYPGARMVIDLNQAPCTDSGFDGDSTSGWIMDLEDVRGPISGFTVDADLDRELPRHYKVLFVDDERNHRLLARRALGLIRPEWDFHEASSAEACLQLCERETFDLIFMDQYMCSVEQSLKGTEAVRALRTRGVLTTICGLSANNLEGVFLNAGADMFHVKPFPMEPVQLTTLLIELVRKRREPALTESMTIPDVSETDYCDLPLQNCLSQELSLPSGGPSPMCGSAHTKETDSLSSSESPSDLPPNLSVLFCDDDRSLRRLAMRALQKLVPDCHVREASSGETALLLCESEEFDIVFMDHYMTSTIDSALLGTETVRELRRQGCKSLICGLSANQQAEAFLAAGADQFILKPFPCKAAELRQVLTEILAKRKGPRDSGTIIEV